MAGAAHGRGVEGKTGGRWGYPGGGGGRKRGGVKRRGRLEKGEGGGGRRENDVNRYFCQLE